MHLPCNEFFALVTTADSVSVSAALVLPFGIPCCMHQAYSIQSRFIRAKSDCRRPLREGARRALAPMVALRGDAVRAIAATVAVPQPRDTPPAAWQAWRHELDSDLELGQGPHKHSGVRD